MASGAPSPFVYVASGVSLRDQAVMDLDAMLAHPPETPLGDVSDLAVQARALIVEGWV